MNGDDRTSKNAVSQEQAGDGHGGRSPDRRHAIMQAAERLFTSLRFHEITLDHVAAAAGVAKGTIYNYFDDKDDLFFQTSINGLDELCELIAGSVPGNASFTEQLLGACRQISEFFDRRHQWLRMMQVEDGRMCHYEGDLRRRWMEKRKALVQAVAGIMGKGVLSGQVREDISPEVLANLMLGMLRTRARDLADLPTDMRRFEIIVDVFRRGAGPQKDIT
jgi:AcrR family transcriptional regulator